MTFEPENKLIKGITAHISPTTSNHAEMPPMSFGGQNIKQVSGGTTDQLYNRLDS